MRFENSVVIGQPVKQVFEFVTNIQNNVKWQTDIMELEMTSESPYGLGATYRCVNRFMGKRIESEGTITDYAPDKSCRLQITSGAYTAECNMSFEAFNGGTKFTATGVYDPGLFKLFKMIVKRKVNQQMKQDMLNLKRILENGGGTLAA